MTLSIRDPDVDRMARELAADSGESITAVIKRALSDLRAKRPSTAEQRLARAQKILDRLDALPVVDPRSSKEILDELYDENGLPK